MELPRHNLLQIINLAAFNILYLNQLLTFLNDLGSAADDLNQLFLANLRLYGCYSLPYLYKVRSIITRKLYPGNFNSLFL